MSAISFSGYTDADHREQLAEDARPYIPPCDTCGQPTERGDFGLCRHWCCADCAASAYPHYSGCLACLREEVQAERNVWRRERHYQASWHAEACPFPLCGETEAHEHVVGLNTVVAERIFVDR